MGSHMVAGNAPQTLWPGGHNQDCLVTVWVQGHDAEFWVNYGATGVATAIPGAPAARLLSVRVQHGCRLDVRHVGGAAGSFWAQVEVVSIAPIP